MNQKFLDSMKSDKSELQEKIDAHIREKGSIRYIKGILKDEGGKGAFVEDVIRTEDGVFLKLYGISYLFRGNPNESISDSVAVTKGAIYETIRRFPWILLTPKKMEEWILSIYFKDLEKKQLPLRDFKMGIRELIRVGKKHMNERLVYCFAMCLESDNAYWKPLQDILSELDKTNDPIEEVKRLMDKLIERQVFEPMKAKYKPIKKLLSVALLFPKVKRIVSEAILDLDISKIQPDDADKYFNLNMTAYNYGGAGYALREAMWDWINKKKGHTFWA